MALVNGIKIINLRLFVLDRFGAAAWSRVTDVLDDGERALLDAVDPVGWYECTLSERLTHELWEVFDDDSYRLMHELGRFEADREFATMHRWVVPLVEPLVAIQNIDVYWRRSNDTGRWTSHVDGTGVSASLSEWATVSAPDCHRVLGYLSRTLQLFGGQVGAAEHPQCRARDAAACTFRAQVTFSSRAPRQGYRVALADVPAIGRELAQCIGPEALVQAIQALFGSHLGYQRVALWSQGEAGRAGQLLCAAGTARTSEVRRYVLERSGRVVGKLELGAPRVAPGAEDEQVLRELLPWIAVTVEQLAAAAPAAGRKPAAVSLEERLARSRQRWHLTPRQCEVLALLVHGRTNGEIAEALSCREGTVELHVHSLLAKCGAENRSMLTALFWCDGEQRA
jgi:DNA-binding CsgD family transcriptional regulator